MNQHPFNDICDFHEKFGIPRREIGKMPPMELMRFRLKRLLEEVKELATALAKRDMAEVTDALVDIGYINLANAHLLNVPFVEAWDEVHASNMRKERAKSAGASKYGSTYDIVKPQGWVKPNIAKLIPVADLALRIPEPRREEQHDLIDYLEELKLMEKQNG